MLQLLPLLLPLLPLASAYINTTSTSSLLTLSNARFHAVMNKTTSYITTLTLDGVDMLGTPVSATSAIGPYMDCVCTPSQANYVPGLGASYQVVQGVDSTGVEYGGMIMSQVIPGTGGEILEQYWFLRATETALHSFTRLAYHNSTVPFLADLQALRTLFRPHGTFYTHLIANEDFYVPKPTPDPAVDSVQDLGVATLVQDTTWYLGNRTNDPYVTQVSPYFTKYSLSDTLRSHNLHGLYADGTGTSDNTTFGAWTILGVKDTYFGGPTYSDLMVDGLLYNYMVSNHHGDQTPNITDGFDRTFGPSVFYLNHGAKGGSRQDLQADALQFATNSYASQFYDDIAHHIPNYVPTAGRGTFKAHITVPSGATNTIAILSAPGYDYQDNVYNTTAYQYWGEVPASGELTIDRVKAGTYRLTVYADGIFGDYVQEGVIISATKQNNIGNIKWSPESAGTELWRIGTPDKSAGEYKHGYAADPTHPLHPPEYRIYWGAYDYINDFPNGTYFHIGKDDESQALNYVHWSSFGGSLTRPASVGSPLISNWTLSFDVGSGSLSSKTNATFTVQLAAASSQAGNTDIYSTNSLNSLPYNVAVNGNALSTWVIPYYRSSSCAIRSGITCYQNSHKFTFPASYLKSNATNTIVLALPFNKTNSISVMYDAMRLEVN